MNPFMPVHYSQIHLGIVQISRQYEDMKAFAFLSPALIALAAACMPYENVQSPLRACPMEGLEALAFFSGKPAQGQVIAPQPVASGDGGRALEWVFGPARGSVHVSCRYDDGAEVVQRLPDMMRSCRADYDDAGRMSRLLCDVSR